MVMRLVIVSTLALKEALAALRAPLAAAALPASLGGAGQVLCSLAADGGLLGAHQGDSEAGGLGEGCDFGSSSLLVGVKDGTELATGTLGSRVKLVGGLHNVGDLTAHLLVDSALVTTSALNVASHDSNLTLEAG